MTVQHSTVHTINGATVTRQYTPLESAQIAAATIAGAAYTVLPDGYVVQLRPAEPPPIALPLGWNW